MTQPFLLSRGPPICKVTYLERKKACGIIIVYLVLVNPDCRENERSPTLLSLFPLLPLSP